MNFREALSQRRYRRFINDTHENTIAKYFNIKPKNGSLEFIVSDYTNGRYKFTVKYKNKYIPKCDFIKLPNEINNKINSYLDDFITIELIVDLRHNYPFSRPIWHVINVEDSYSTRLHIKLLDYYKYINKIHNNMYKNNNWSPAIDLRTDIILFISRINHFDIFDNY
jgi:hypothetical protein